jgi:cytosine/adenosine deaminase-related metal-dependent hydrolase
VTIPPTRTGSTPGLVCAHHHLYSALARGMPAPPADASTFLEVLEQV